MAQNYTRQSSLADGDTITAALFNNEYNQLVNAFAYSSSSASSTGHRHDGTAGQGGNVPQIGDLDFLNKVVVDGTNNRVGFFVEVSSSAVEQIRVQDGAVVPVTDNDIDLGTSSLEFKDLFLDGTAHVDTLDVDVNATIAGTLGVTGATTLSSTLAVTGAITGSSTIQGTTITATTAFVPDASDGAALGTSALEFSDLFLADGSVINLGADQDTTLTHVADTGILLNSTRQLQFGDSGTYIHQSADGVLDLVSDTEIEINATTIDMNGALDLSGNATVGGTLGVTGAITGSSTVQGTTITATTAFVPDAADGASLGTVSLEFSDLFLADGALIAFGNDQDVTLTHLADAGLILNDARGLFFNDTSQYINAPNNTTLDIAATDEIELTATLVDINANVEVSGTLTVAGAVDFGDATLSNVGAVQLDSIAGDADSNTSITFSGSDVITIAAGGDNQVTFTNGAIVPSTDNDIDLGTSSVEFKDAFFDGTVTTDALVADTADINGGTVDGAIIGGNSAAAITGTAITGTSFVIGSADISEAELETIDGVTAGTVAASKAVVVDANKDIGSFRNITLTGELDAGSLDISGDADIDGTLETDALSINGTAVTSTAAELNALDGITAVVGELNALDLGSTAIGTAIASKAVVLDANKDYTGIRNFSITGDLSVAGTTTVVDSVQMTANNAVIFEGATADASETTLTSIDATADRTISLPNQSGTLPVLAAVSTTAITSTPEELNVLDGITAVVGELNALDLGSTAVGTAIASKAVILDSNKDYTGIRNFTISGELDAATLDISGDIDVDGTTNLDVVDIDGAVDMASTLQVDGAITSSAGATITVADNSDNLTLTTTDADADVGPSLSLYRNSGTPADNDALGLIKFIGRNDNSQDVEFSKIDNYLLDASDGSEDGAMTLRTMVAGTQRNRLDITPTELVINESSVDVNFRVESDGNANMLFVDGGDNRVGVNTGSPAATFTVKGTANTYAGGFQVEGADETSAFAIAHIDGATFISGNATNDHLKIAADGSLSTPTAGTSNLRLGVNAGNSIASDGNYNTVVGDEAGTAITGGDYNTFLGYAAGAAVDTSFNTLIGGLAGDALNTGDSNVAVGYGALTVDTKGARSVAIGREALATQNFTSGTNTYNVAVGDNAGKSVTTGTNNTLVGGLAGDAITVGYENVALGYLALSANIDGRHAVAIGAEALKIQEPSTASSTYNVAVGYNAGGAVTTGIQNTFVGGLAGDGTDDGQQNTAMGYGALSANCGNENTAVGFYALIGSTAGRNTAIGWGAGDSNTTGGDNIYIGYDAAAYQNNATEGSNNTIIGAFARTSNATVDNEIVIGRYALGQGDSTATLGLNGNGATISIDGSDTSWAAHSDERLKDNITTSTAGLSFINDLRPVTYTWKAKNEISEDFTNYYDAESSDPVNGKAGKTYHGFVAQEVKATIDAHSEIANGNNIWAERVDDIQQLAPGNLVPMLVKAVQELSAQVTALQAEVNTLKGG